MKKGLLIVGLILVLGAGTVLAATTANTVITAVINPGTLSVTAPASTSFTAVDLDAMPDTGTTTNATVSPVKIKDHRSGVAAGWSVTMTSTNLESGAGTIPVTNLDVTPGDITAVGNSSLTGVSKGSQHTFTGTSDPASLAVATSSNGRGRYNQDEIMALFVDISTAPGTYNATSTVTIAMLDHDSVN